MILTEKELKIEKIKNKIEDIQINYKLEQNNDFIKDAYNYLTKKRIFEGLEYRFLCWLNYKFKYNIKIKTPYINKPKLLKVVDFERSYLISDKRKNLYLDLKHVLDYFRTKFNSDKVKILVGGSYTDLEVTLPDDIDVCIIYPKSIKRPGELKVDYTIFRSKKRILNENKLDIQFLPENYNLAYFNAYSIISMLGNNAFYKDKEKIAIPNNSFTKREIIEIEI